MNQNRMTWLSLTFLFVLAQASGVRSSTRLNYDRVETSQDETTVYVVFDGNKLQIKTGSVSSYVAKAFLKSTMNSTG